MTIKEFNALKPGLYVIHWKDDNFVEAAVGAGIGGERWMAPTTWMSQVRSGDERHRPIIRNIKSVQRLSR